MPTPLDIKVTTTGATQSAEELNKLGAAAAKVEAATKGAAKGGKEAGDAFDQFGKKGSAAKDAFEGVAQTANGGAAALFGFSKAWINVKEAFATNPITAILGVLLGSLALVQKGFDLLVERAEAARDKMFGTGEQTKKLNDALAAVAETSKKALAATQADVQKLNEEYSRLNGELDRSVQRFKTIETARAGAEVAQLEQQRQAELAKPGADAGAINKKFDAQVSSVKDNSALAVSNRETGAARLKKENASDKLSGLAAKRRDITRRADRASEAFAYATDPTTQAKARAELEAADAQLAQFDKDNAKEIDGAQSDIADAGATITASGFNDKARASTKAAEAQSKVSSARASLKDAADSGAPTEKLFRDLIKALAESAAAQKEAAAAQQQAARPNQGGTITRGGETTVVPGDPDKDKAQREFAAASTTADKATTTALKEATASKEKLVEQVKNSR